MASPSERAGTVTYLWLLGTSTITQVNRKVESKNFFLA